MVQVLIICLVAEHSLLLLKFYVAVKLNDSPLWILKSKVCRQLPSHAPVCPCIDYVLVRLLRNFPLLCCPQAYLNWLKSRSGTSDQHPTAETYERHSAALQAEYEDESDLERFWL